VLVGRSLGRRTAVLVIRGLDALSGRLPGGTGRHRDEG
jgi:hypothetical protein